VAVFSAGVGVAVGWQAARTNKNKMENKTLGFMAISFGKGQNKFV
jgi:hypothetical protein